MIVVKTFVYIKGWKISELNTENETINAEDVKGPVTTSLDKILKDIGVERCAYFGNTINGNHGHLLMKKDSIKKLCDGIGNVIIQEFGENETYRNALIEINKISIVLHLYVACHNNCARFIDIPEGRWLW